jgi:hypothetical protein
MMQARLDDERREAEAIAQVDSKAGAEEEKQEKPAEGQQKKAEVKITKVERSTTEYG